MAAMTGGGDHPVQGLSDTNTRPQEFMFCDLKGLQYIHISARGEGTRSQPPTNLLEDPFKGFLSGTFTLPINPMHTMCKNIYLPARNIGTGTGASPAQRRKVGARRMQMS